MPAVRRLYSAPDALSGGKVENLVANAESGSASRVTLVTGRYQEDVLVDDRGPPSERRRQPPAGPCWRSPRCGRRRPEPGSAPATGRAWPALPPRRRASSFGSPAGQVSSASTHELVRSGRHRLRWRQRNAVATATSHREAFTVSPSARVSPNDSQRSLWRKRGVPVNAVRPHPFYSAAARAPCPPRRAYAGNAVPRPRRARRPPASPPLRSARKELLAPPCVVPPSAHPPEKAKLIASHRPLSYQ